MTSSKNENVRVDDQLDWLPAFDVDDATVTDIDRQFKEEQTRVYAICDGQLIAEWAEKWGLTHISEAWDDGREETFWQNVHVSRVALFNLPASDRVISAKWLEARNFKMDYLQRREAQWLKKHAGATSPGQR